MNDNQSWFTCKAPPKIYRAMGKGKLALPLNISDRKKKDDVLYKVDKSDNFWKGARLNTNLARSPQSSLHPFPPEISMLVPSLFSCAKSGATVFVIHC